MKANFGRANAKSTHEKPELIPHAENLKPTNKNQKFLNFRRKKSKKLMMNNFDCSSFIPVTQILNFIPLSSHFVSHYSSNLMKV